MSERAERGERAERVGRLWNGGESILAAKGGFRHKAKEKKEMDEMYDTYFLEITKTPIPNQ